MQTKQAGAEAFRNQGEPKNMLGQYHAAIVNYNKAIQLNPRVDAYYNRGMAKDRLGQLDTAIEDFKAAIQQNPNDVDARFALRRAQEALKRK